MSRKVERAPGRRDLKGGVRYCALAFVQWQDPANAQAVELNHILVSGQ